MRKFGRTYCRRWISFLLTLVLLIQLVPAMSFASDGSQSDSTFAGFIDWTVTGGKLSAVPGLSGNGASITPDGKEAVLQSAAVTVAAAEQLRVGIFVKVPTNGKATLCVQWYSDTTGKKAVGEPEVVATHSTAGDYTELAGDVTVPENVQSAALLLLTGTSGEYLADNAYIRAYSDLPEFIDHRDTSTDRTKTTGLSHHNRHPLRQ